MRWCILSFVALTLAFAAWGCGHDVPLSSQTLNPAGSAAVLARGPAGLTTADGTARHWEGVLGPGAHYVIDVPANWNGELVVWIHGYTFPQQPVTPPTVGLSPFLLSQGFAVAASSFSENGYAVAEAIRQTHQLSGLFADLCGQPQRTYLIGASLGGIIGLRLVEKYPQQYDGALLACGVVGGSRAEIQYVGDIRVMFDYFFPGCIPGELFSRPEGVSFETEVVPAFLAKLGTAEGQQKFQAFLACAREKGLRFNSINEAVQGTLQVLGYTWYGGQDFIARTHDHVPYDNDDVVYTCPGLPQQIVDGLNAGVRRYSSTRDAEAFLRHYYEPDGDLEIPVITHHTTRDPLVPLFHEDLFRSRVQAAGKSNLLLERTRSAFGHCNFQQTDLPLAFLDLVSWVRTGQKPAA